MQEDKSLAVQDALTEDEQQKIVRGFVALNPHYQGAEVADILSELENADSHLDILEPMWDAHAIDIGKYPQGLFSMAGLAAVYLADERPGWDEVKALMDRVVQHEGAQAASD